MIVSYQVNRGKSCLALISLFAFTLSLPKILPTCASSFSGFATQDSAKLSTFMQDSGFPGKIWHQSLDYFIVIFIDILIFTCFQLSAVLKLWLTDAFYHPNVFQWALLAGMKYRICTEKRMMSSLCSELDWWFHISKHLFGLCLIIICVAFFAKCIYVILFCRMNLVGAELPTCFITSTSPTQIID